MKRRPRSINREKKVRVNQTEQAETKPSIILGEASSQYSKQYANYMRTEYPSIQRLIRLIITLPCCQPYYLRYPLFSMLRGVCKKMMLNFYELTIYAYFLSNVNWGLDRDIYGSFTSHFPMILHVTEPCDSQETSQLSMFLYFSAYSVKDMLNASVEIYLREMTRLFSKFEDLHSYWVAQQPTTANILDPKVLNKLYSLISNQDHFLDYNVIVDRIIQISPCYDLGNKTVFKADYPSQQNLKQPLSEDEFKPYQFYK